MNKQDAKMIDLDGAVDHIVYRLKSAGKPLRLIATEAGVSYHWLSSFLQKRRPNPGIKNLQKLAEYVNKFQS